MNVERYLKLALDVLRSHPPGLDYSRFDPPDPHFGQLFALGEWSEAMKLPPVVTREYQEALAVYLARIGARQSLPETILCASPYGDIEDVALRRLLIDAADTKLSALG
jgi:hypothetical protein